MDSHKNYFREAQVAFRNDTEAVKLTSDWMEHGGDEKPMLRADGSPLQGVMPSGKPVFEAFWNGITKRIEDPNGGTCLYEDETCAVIIPAGFRKAKTWNTMNPYRYEIGEGSTLQSLLHIIVLPKMRIDSPLSLKKEHIELLENMRVIGRSVMEGLYKGESSNVGSLNWVLAQNEVVKVGEKTMTTRVKSEDLSPYRDVPLSLNHDEKMKTVKESFHVDTFSVRYLHLHMYADEWRTVAYDKMEEESRGVGKKKNIPLDAVLEVLRE